MSQERLYKIRPVNRECVSDLANRLSSYVNRELGQIEKPGSPAHVHKFTDATRLGKVLADFIDFPLEIPTISRLHTAFWNSMEPVLSLHLDVLSLPDCIERLATTFESFLKKLAFLIYGTDAQRWEGDGVNYVGIVNTMLGDLIRGRVGKTRAGANAPELHAAIVDSRGLKGAIYNRTRELRNNVHRAQEYSFSEATGHLRLILAAYLLATEEHLNLIERTIYPQFAYLQNFVKRLKTTEHHYIELMLEESDLNGRIDLLDPPACEWRDDFAHLEIPNSSMQSGERTTLGPRRRGPISKFAAEIPRLIIIGGGGSGKTTTLQRLAAHQAEKVLAGLADAPIPVYLEANRYARTFRFIRYIEVETGLNSETLENLLKAGKIAIYIDGLNEVLPAFSAEAMLDLKNLLAEWPQCNAVISTRTAGFQNIFNLPTFELQGLTLDQIKVFLSRSIGDGRRVDVLFEALQNDKRLFEWARNPLLLRMVTKVAAMGELPRNRGEMLMRFVAWIFSRERKTRGTNIPTKENVLAHLAYEMRSAGQITVPRDVGVEMVRIKLSQVSPALSPHDIIDQLITNQFLRHAEPDNLKFFHEVMQEFFAAKELN